MGHGTGNQNFSFFTENCAKNSREIVSNSNIKAAESMKGQIKARLTRMSWIWADLRTRRPLAHQIANHICLAIFPRILTPTGYVKKAKIDHRTLVLNVTESKFTIESKHTKYFNNFLALQFRNFLLNFMLAVSYRFES